MNHSIDWVAILMLLFLIAGICLLLWIIPHPVEAPMNDDHLQWIGCETE